MIKQLALEMDTEADFGTLVADFGTFLIMLQKFLCGFSQLLGETYIDLHRFTYLRAT